MILTLRTVLFLCAFTINSFNAERILFVLPLATRSETHLFIPLAKELALKGYDVTFVSPVSSGFKIKNFREIIPLPALDLSDFEQSTSNPLEGRKHQKNTFLSLMSADISFIFDGARKVYENKEFQKLLQESFDLLIVSGNFNNCFDGLIHKFQAPFIILSSMPAYGHIEDLTGFGGPPSFVPNPFLEFTDRMTFRERFENTLLRWIFSWATENFIAVESEKVYRQYLGQDYPSMMEIERNVSLVFSNSHFAVTSPRPVMPDMIEIGGIHCREAQQLPKVLTEFKQFMKLAS